MANNPPPPPPLNSRCTLGQNVDALPTDDLNNTIQNHMLHGDVKRVAQQASNPPINQQVSDILCHTEVAVGSSELFMPMRTSHWSITTTYGKQKIQSLWHSVRPGCFVVSYKVGLLAIIRTSNQNEVPKCLSKPSNTTASFCKCYYRIWMMNIS